MEGFDALVMAVAGWCEEWKEVWSYGRYMIVWGVEGLGISIMEGPG